MNPLLSVAATPPPPPPDGDPATIALLAQALTASGYGSARVREVAGVDGSGLTPLPLLVRKLAAEDPVAGLVALFSHGVAVDLAAAERALDPVGVAGAERLGVLQVVGTEAVATVRLAPFRGLFLASDRAEVPFRDYVMAGAGSTRTLADLSIRRPSRSVLDLGTGTGVHAFLAAPTAERVTAVDVNPRALAFARFNARLNGIDNVEFCEGSWYEPVAGRRFELILSNPPFVVAPEGEFLFRDGGQGGIGDEVSRSLVRSAPEHLTEGGVAQFLINWVHGRTSSWSDPVRSWVLGSGCDAWLLRGASDDPGRYSIMWNQHLAADRAAHAAAIEHWLAWFDRAGVEAIGFGLLTLRRRGGAAWFRADELPEATGPAAGAQLEAALAAHDVLAGLTDLSALLDTRPITNPEHRLEQVLAFRDGRYQVEAAQVRLTAPLGFTADVDVFSATLLTLLDGSRTLADAVALAAEVLPEAPEDLPDRVAGIVASMVVMGLVQV